MGLLSKIKDYLLKKEEPRQEKFQKAQYVNLRDIYGEGVDVHLIEKEMSFFLELLDGILGVIRSILIVVTLGLYLLVSICIFLIMEKLFGFSRDITNYWLLIDHTKKTGTLLKMKRNHIEVIEEKANYYTEVVEKENNSVYKGLRSYDIRHVGLEYYERVYETEYDKYKVVDYTK